jgi:tetratricopeptide (TPR) repeat protein
MKARALLLLTVGLLLHACTAGPRATPAPREESLREAALLATQADRAMRAGRHDQAIDLGRQAVALQPSLGAAWNNLGISLMETGQNMDAVQSFQRAADVSPADPKPYENLGLLYMRVGWGEDALRYYQLSLEREPNWLPSLRGATAAAKALLRSSEGGLEVVKRGLLIEQDSQWRRVFESERLRITGELTERTRALRSPT